MKKLIFTLGLGLIIGMININRADAQVHVSINIDIQPAWGPSGYNYAEFYYIPEINVYYNVVSQIFYYNNRGRWTSSIFLPAAYSYYDFYSLYKVVLNGVHNPWKYNRRHARLYAGYCNNYVQVPIFYMKESHYHKARVNYHGWVESRYMPRNSGRPSSHDYSMNTRNGRINDSRSKAPDIKRSNAVSSRNSRNEATTSSRSSSNSNTSVRSSSNNNKNNPVVSSNSSRRSNDTSVRSSNSNSRNNSNVSSRSNDTRSSNTSVRSSSNDKKNNPVVSSNSSRRSNDTSVRSSSSDSKSSRSANSGSSDRKESSRSDRN